MDLCWILRFRRSSNHGFLLILKKSKCWYSDGNSFGLDGRRRVTFLPASPSWARHDAKPVMRCWSCRIGDQVEGCEWIWMDVNVVKNLQNTQCETKQFSLSQVRAIQPEPQSLTITAAALTAAALALDCQRWFTSDPGFGMNMWWTCQWGQFPTCPNFP